MKLPLLLLLSLIFLVSQVSAVVTQQQLDGINADTYNLQCQRETIGTPNFEVIRGTFRIAYSCLDLRRISDGQYEIQRRTFYPSFLLKDYLQCKREFDLQTCVNKFVGIIQSNINTEKYFIRERIKKFQTIDTTTLESEFGNINVNG